MTDRDPFLRAIEENPDDPDTHLVFADWLEDQGDPAAGRYHRERGLILPILNDPDDDSLRLKYAEVLDQNHWDEDRAAFIRVQVELAKWTDGDGYMPMGLNRERLREREQSLFQQSPATHQWFGPALHLVPAGAIWYGFLPWWRRGFIHSVAARWDEFRDHGDAIVREQPVQEVTLLTLPAVELHQDPQARTWTWRLEIPTPDRQRRVVAIAMDERAIDSLAIDWRGYTREQILRRAWPRVRQWHLPPPEPPRPPHLHEFYLELGGQVWVNDFLTNDAQGRGVAASRPTNMVAMERGGVGDRILVFGYGQPPAVTLPEDIAITRHWAIRPVRDSPGVERFQAMPLIWDDPSYPRDTA